MSAAPAGGVRPQPSGPLAGIRVLELGSFIAAPMAGRVFAEFGADVVKVERPGSGDELRSWRRARGDTSLLFRTMGRGKRSVTLDLQDPKGRDIALRLVSASDVVLENFRPGTLERWGLGPEVLQSVRPDLVLVRISGYGQTGPYRGRPGFASVAESLAGLRNLTGDPDRPPVRVGVSLGDTLAGLYGTIGALMALLRRERTADPAPETIDVALYEAVFGVLEDLVPEYDGYGVVRTRTGAALPGIVPSNTYPTAGGGWVVIGGNGDAIYRRLMAAVERADLADDPRLADNAGRVAHRALIDDAIAEWTGRQDLATVLGVLEGAGVPVGPIYDAADILTDPHYAARDMLVRHDVELKPGEMREVAFPGVVPKLQRSPGDTRWVGPDLGAHTLEVLTELAGINEDDVARLRQAGIV